MMRKYDSEKDVPRTGWDEMQINHYLLIGVVLFVDENCEVWTVDKADYVGRIIR